MTKLFSALCLFSLFLFHPPAFSSGTEEQAFKIKVNITSMADPSFAINTTGSGYDYNVDCDNDGVYDITGATGNAVCHYTTATTYTISISGDFPQIAGCSASASHLIGVEQWGENQWRSMKNAFKSCAYFNELTASDT
ncbi:MAG: hypothetical protein KAG20_02720, partial [Cocleimonas sp.]|nr:hypothetical protein [Cocleimonas sp.]